MRLHHTALDGAGDSVDHAAVARVQIRHDLSPEDAKFCLERRSLCSSLRQLLAKGSDPGFIFRICFGIGERGLRGMRPRNLRRTNPTSASNAALRP